MRLHFKSAVTAVALGGAFAQAVEPARPGMADVLAARSALVALDADPALRDVNLVVSVVDGVAVVGGAVPSADLGKRAEEVVRRATGAGDVKNRCFVQGKPDPLIRAVADRLTPGARTPAASDLPGVVRPPRGTPAVVANPLPPETAVAAGPTAAAVVARKIPSDAGRRPSFLLAPVAADAGPAAAVASVPEAVRVRPGPAIPVSLPTRAAEVMGGLLDLRRADDRFAGLSLDLRNGVVVLTGRAPQAADAWDFADAARRVPGVRQVIVGNVAPR